MLTVRDVMVPDPVTLAPTDTLRFAAGVLTSIGASGAPVTKGDRVVGVVSMTDILEFAADTQEVPPPPAPRPERDGADASMAVPESPDWDVLDEHTVAEVMALRVLALAPDAAVNDAARLMESEAVHRIIVMEGDRMLGIVTAWDLVLAVARGDLVPREGA